MAQSSREAAVVRVRNVPPRALRSREGRSDRVLQRAPCIRRRHTGSAHGSCVSPTPLELLPSVYWTIILTFATPGPPWTTRRKGDPQARHHRAHDRTHAPGPHARSRQFHWRTAHTAGVIGTEHRRHLQAPLAAAAGWYDAQAARYHGALHVNEEPPNR